MMFSFMLTDEKSSLKVCKHCGKAFAAGRPKFVNWNVLLQDILIT